MCGGDRQVDLLAKHAESGGGGGREEEKEEGAARASRVQQDPGTGTGSSRRRLFTAGP